MSYGMHEHCCDCSYPCRQEAVEIINKLHQDLAAAQRERDQFHDAMLRQAADLAAALASLRELIGMIEIAAVMPDAINKHLRVNWDDPALQRARAALAGEKK